MGPSGINYFFLWLSGHVVKTPEYFDVFLKTLALKRFFLQWVAVNAELITDQGC